MRRGNCLVSGSAVPAAHYPWTGPARWLRTQSSASTGKLIMPKGLASAPKNSTLRMGGPTNPRSCRHTLVQSVPASPLLKLPRGASPVHASVLAASHYLRSWSERWSWARPAAFAGKPLLQKRLGHPPRPRSCSPHLVCRLQARSSTCPKSRRADMARVGAHSMIQDAQTVSATQDQIAATGRTRTFALAPAQHDIPIDGLLSFTLPCAIQYTCCLLAALWLRDQHKHSLSCRDRRNLGSWIHWHGVGGCAHCLSKPPSGHQP